jgi:hypothetical protein
MADIPIPIPVFAPGDIGMSLSVMEESGLSCSSQEESV